MDMLTIGNFLADLRKEHNLTQEQLGDELGVTNKTVSRWETGTYLPPVEMLQMLSDKYNVTINEILSGERLTSAEQYKQQAESNIKTALDKSVFSLKDKKNYFSKKWLKDHCAELVIEIIVLIAMAVVVSIFWTAYSSLVAVAAIAWSFITNNRKMSYVEGKLYDEGLKHSQEENNEKH